MNHPSTRITQLDFIRGVAVLGMPIMNAISFGLPPAAYYNLDAAGSEAGLDWIIGVLAEIFIDQKAMALFSLLFGAGIALFADHAASKRGNPIGLSLWRNALLFVIGVLHSLLWIGDVLVVYAFCAPLVILCRNLPPKMMLTIGVLLALVPVAIAAYVQALEPTAAQLGDFWLAPAPSMSDAVGVYVLSDAFLRALGLMFVGVALYRWGAMQGQLSERVYRSLAWVGLGFGLPLATLGIGFQIWTEFSPDWAVASEIPNTLATLPMALGYMSLIILWSGRASNRLRERIEAVGRMALTNYLSQTVIGMAVLNLWLDQSLNRTGLLIFVAVLVAAQLLLSRHWLSQHRYGPVEWLWRSATYRRWEPLRRNS